MPVELKIPAMGESIREAIVGQWRKADGSAVRKDEVLVDLETDKVTQELFCPQDGVLKITVAAGTTVPIGAVIGTVDETAVATAPAAAPAAAAASPAPVAKPAPAPAAVAVGSPAEPSKPPPSSAGFVGLSATGLAQHGEGIEHHVISPLARKVAHDLGIDVLGVKGTGPQGRVTRSDIEEIALQRKSAAQVTAAPAGATPAGARQVTREPMSALRKRIAERLVEAQRTAAMLTTFNEADLSAVMALRKRYKEEFEKKHGVGLGFMGFFVAAVCSALKAIPRLNAQIHTDPAGKSEIVQHHYVDCGVAVSTERGLIVPVIRNAEQLGLAQVELAIKDLATRARENKIAVDELAGGTFTITNGGIFGSLMSTPILNPPQAGILGMHKIQDRPVAVDGQVVIRPMMYLALSYDHRLVDGSEAVRFLVHVKQAIESPERLLLGV